MSISSEKLRKVLHPIQIDTMHFRFKPRRNPGSQSQHRSVNRTAVVFLENLSPPPELLAALTAETCVSRNLCRTGLAIIEKKTGSLIVLHDKQLSRA